MAEENREDIHPENENTGENADEETREPTEEELQEARAAMRKKLREQQEERLRLIKEGGEAISEGKGVLRLEVPIRIGDREIKELTFDFTKMKGHEYTDAMGSDPMAMNAMRITPRQALALFAKSASKYTEGVDMDDIIAEIAVTDSVEAVQVATLFFNASTQAGRMRISKKSSSQA